MAEAALVDDDVFAAIDRCLVELRVLRLNADDERDADEHRTKEPFHGAYSIYSRA